MNHDVVVVGAGLFGSIIAASLRRRGMDVVVIDDARPGAGSLPAACLMKPGWFSSLGNSITEPALNELDALYSVQDLKFKVGPVSATVYWVPPASILQGPDIHARVYSLLRVEGGWQVFGSEDNLELPLMARHVVLATGVWANELAKDPLKVKGQAGMAFLWEGATVKQPFIAPWAPYKQLVAFNRGDGLWVGDGTAIKAENWTEENASRSQDRCSRAVGLGSVPPKRLFGIRPYADEKPCVLVEQRPGLWVATGGAKNGTLAAGHCGHRLAEALS